MIKFRVRSGRWRQIHPGVYATFSGDLTRRTRLWAAVLSAGPGAALSHETAAELHQLADKPAELIHITVPAGRRISAAEGVSLHRSARVMEAVQASTYPPRTRVEETVLDLTQAAKTFDDVCGWVTRAFAMDLTDEARLSAAMTARTKLRWRADLNELIVAAAGGDHSVLEFRYHRDVERAHGLPESARQVPFTTPGGGRGRPGQPRRRRTLATSAAVAHGAHLTCAQPYRSDCFPSAAAALSLVLSRHWSSA